MKSRNSFRAVAAGAFACALVAAAAPFAAAGDPGDCDVWDLAIGVPGLGGEVRDIIHYQGDTPGIVVVGNFTTAGGNAINRVARFDAPGNDWHPFGTPPDDGAAATVRAAIEYNGDLIIGGSFTMAGGVSAVRVARWDGVSGGWHAMGAGFDQVVTDFAIYNGELYASGTFLNSGTQPIQRVARWDEKTQTWLPVANAINNPVTCMAVYDGELYIAGSFSQVNGMTVNNIARWNGPRNQWNTVGTGVAGGGVSSIAVGHDSVYVGGAFTMAGGAAAPRVARWDGPGNQWHAVGTGMGNNSVLALAVHEDFVYAGGTFTTAGGQSAVRAARFDFSGATGSDWQSMGSVSSVVQALHVDGNEVLFGGLFTAIDGKEANRIAAWVPCVDDDAPFCLGDITLDGNVGVADLLALLACWGPVAPGDPCEAALVSTNEFVGVVDLLLLLGNWGPCPR